MDLSTRGRKRRVNYLAQNILAYNVCPETLDKEGMDYLIDNRSLTNEVSVF